MNQWATCAIHPSAFCLLPSAFILHPLPRMSGQLIDSIRRGDARALAKAISLVERESPDAERILAELYGSTGRARIIGITGSPGAGKSTLVAALAKHYRRQDKRVGIVAVDPTSPFSGGAILGDRIRM